MTEQEIVSCLKENKDKCIAFGFLHEEVRAWVCIMPISIFRFFDGKEWIKSENTFARFNDIICLPDNYELEKIEKIGEWVEFAIDSDGFFAFQFKNNNFSSFFFWWNWQKFLESNHQNNGSFIAFGGWQYENDERWYLAPTIQSECGTIWNSYRIIDVGEVKPIIPKKIRFWKEYK